MNQNETRRKRIPTFEETVTFHGHACPGLALGYRVAVAAMNRLCAARFQHDTFLTADPTCLRAQHKVHSRVGLYPTAFAPPLLIYFESVGKEQPGHFRKGVRNV